MTPREHKYHRRKREAQEDFRLYMRFGYQPGCQNTEWKVKQKFSAMVNINNLTPIDEEMPEGFGPILYSLPEEIAFEQFLPIKKNNNDNTNPPES